jgi:L-iditol 2-dehydrogenase
VRIEQSGVCASELGLWTGKEPDELPAEVGHEIAGVVEAVGEEVASVAAGDSVVVWVPEGGGFAERMLTPERWCIRVAPGLAYPAVAEPLGCIVGAVELAEPALGDDVVIVGAGFMGHLVHRLVELRGPRQVIVADVRDDALERAASLGAATTTVNVARDSLTDAVLQRTNGAGADVTFEVTGTQAALDGLAGVTRMSGTVVIAGYHQGEPRRIPLGEWNWKAFRIVNGHFRELSTILNGMRAGMRLLTSGRISMDGLVTHRFPLEEIDDAFRIAQDKPDGFVKATVMP